ncbi:MAG: hypothetical protein AB7G21_06305 [Dehalococcoidia bacterium]
MAERREAQQRPAPGAVPAPGVPSGPAIGVDRVRWGPIIGGVAVSLASLLVLTVLGLAVGLAAFEPDEIGGGTFSTASSIWGIVSALVAFALGGWFAAYSAGVTGSNNGMLNGMMVGVSAIVLMLWFVGAGLGNLLGAVAGNLDAAMGVGQQVTGAADASALYDQAQSNSWISLIGLVLALGASGFGGWVGHRERANVFAPTRVDAEERRTAYAP